MALKDELGRWGETVAGDFLVANGYDVLDRGWRCRFGEIDIVAREGRTVAFVEVKTRTGDGFGGLEHAVTPQKIRRIRRLAGLWLAGQGGGWPDLRIDVVGVRVGRCRTPEVMHLRGVG